MKIFFGILGVLAGYVVLVSFNSFTEEKPILSYVVDLSKQDLRFFWKDDNNEVLKSFERLDKFTSSNKQELTFAMNGGMFKKDLSPQGLYIENGKVLAPLDTIQKGYRNFYLQPNGIFYITYDKTGHVCKTTDFCNTNVKYATQSGPMLIVNGAIHSAFRKGSSNLNVRNGVGVLANGQLLFAMSIDKINFYDFASYFKSKGCNNALYLDGFVSKTYLPSKGYNNKVSKFGVMIGEVK